MRSLPRTLLYSLAGCLAFVAFVTLLTLTVQYHPPGVKPHQREAYAAKMREIKLYNEAVKAVQSIDPSSRPRAAMESTEYDFGMVDPHATLSHQFRISNIGGAPLTLEVAQTSCKCTLGDLDDRLLQPGQSTTVTLTWNTGYQADHYEQTATLRTNDPLAESIELKVQGEVRAEFVVPDTVVFNNSDLGQPAEAKFVVYSQLFPEFSVHQIQCDLDAVEWHAVPIEAGDARLADTEARSAWEVRLLLTRLDYGEFKGDLAITARPSDGRDDVTGETTCVGKVRAPINFYCKDIHYKEGLDIGTLVAGKEHNFHLIVRARGDRRRKIEVLGVKPDPLQASLEPLSTPGSYRLTITIPADCPMVMFNANHKHGYVHVGDPQDKNFANWFPLIGGVVDVE